MPVFGSDKPVVLVSVFISFLMSTKIIMNVLETITGVEGFDEKSVIVFGELAGVWFGKDSTLVDRIGSCGGEFEFDDRLFWAVV